MDVEYKNSGVVVVQVDIIKWKKKKRRNDRNIKAEPKMNKT